MGNSEELGDLKVDYLNSLRPVLLNPGPQVALTVAILANTMAGEIKSPKAVRTLAALLNSSSVEVRRTAASLLGDIATDSVIAPLARTALQDDDGDVRYFAVIGLAMATKAGPAPTKFDYTAKEDEYLSFWRAWARTNVR
jgi:HEAT repeat protein